MSGIILFSMWCAVMWQWKWVAKEIAKFLILIEQYKDELNGR